MIVRELLGGVPFVDDEFRWEAVLAAVAGRRAWSLGVLDAQALRSCDPRQLLTPSAGRALRIQESIDREIQSAPLSPLQAARVRSALDEVQEAFPQWRGVLGLPLEVRALLDPGVISCSCYAWPQHVFLSPAAFSSDAELREQVIHEICHNWLYLIEELWRLHRAGDGRLFRLPSGTAGRNIAEVIGAAHVAASLLRWYGRREAPAESRSSVLGEYLHGCLDTLGGLEPEALTATGRFLFEGLNAFDRARRAGSAA